MQGVEQRPWLRQLVWAYWALALVLIVPFIYQLVLEATRVSPLSPLDTQVVTETLLASLQLVLPAALLLSLVTITLSLLPFWPRRENGAAPAYITVVMTIALLAVGLLPATENFLYIVVGSSLKTTHEVGIKILVLAVAIVLAAALARPLLALGHQLSRLRSLNALALVGTAVALVSLLWSIDSKAVAGDRTHSRPRYNVLILSSDGIDADRLSVYGYERATTPFLEKISSELLIYRNAFANNAHTTGSITSLFTGRTPLSTHVVYPPDILTGRDALMHLPGILGKFGYYRSNWSVPHFADAVSQNILDAFDSNVGKLARNDVAAWLPSGSVGVGGWLVRRTLSDIQSLLLDITGLQEAPNPFDQITGGGNTLSDQERLEGILLDIAAQRPFFTHVHFMDTHGPNFSPKNRIFSEGMNQAGPFQTEFVDDAIRDFDDRVALVYASLEQAGTLEETILIVTTDHAMKYIPRVRIPLLVRLPDQYRTGEVFENVQRLDLAPTILSFLGLAVPSWMEGLDLLSEIPPDRIILATNTQGARLDDAGQWIHQGSRSFGPHHGITAIYCDRYLAYKLPLKLAGSEKIKGTTSPCRSSDGSEVDGLARSKIRDALEPAMLGGD